MQGTFTVLNPQQFAILFFVRYILVTWVFFQFDYFLEREKEHNVGWVRRWGKSGRKLGGQNIIKLYCIKILNKKDFEKAGTHQTQINYTRRNNKNQSRNNETETKKAVQKNQ